MNLEKYGWSPAWETRFKSWSARGCGAGRVVRQEYGAWLLMEEQGARWLRAARKDVRPWAGDWVAVKGDRIEGLVDRQGAITRRAAGKRPEPQILAANVDVALIVMGLDADFNLRRLARYLELVHAARARAVVLLNKRDTCVNTEARLRETEAVCDAQVLTVSALLDDVATVLCSVIRTGETAALLGSSGAGKSTITNALLHQELQATQSVREHDQRGQHTTTRRELFLTPQGWLIADLPGLREVQAWIE